MKASVGLHYYRYRVSRQAWPGLKDMLTVLLQLYQNRVAGLILPVFSLQYHDQTDFVLSGEQPVLAPEEVFQIDMIITRNVIIRIFEEPAVTHKVTCSISQISRHLAVPGHTTFHRHLRQPVINRGIEMLKLII